MTEKEKRSLKVRLGRRLSSDRPEVMEIVREEINKTPTTEKAQNADLENELSMIKEQLYRLCACLYPQALGKDELEYIATGKQTGGET